MDVDEFLYYPKNKDSFGISETFLITVRRGFIIFFIVFYWHQILDGLPKYS